MKKLTPASKTLQEIRRSQWKRRCARNGTVRARVNTIKREQSRSFYFARIQAPATLSLGAADSHASAVDFIRSIKEAFKNCSSGMIQLDFSGTDRFVIGATLLLYAELSNLISNGSGQVLFRCKPPRNHKAAQVLTQIGMFEMCGQNFRVKPVDQDVVHWRVAKGQKVELSVCNQVLDEIEGRLAEPLQRSIDAGLCEALTNVVHHAYISSRDDGTGYVSSCKNWWVFSQVKNDLMSVGICDLGLGIPRTLQEKHPSLWTRIVEFMQQPSDSHCIAAAIEDSRSRTGERQRGKGLGQIARAVVGESKAYVAIYSNKGSFTQKGDAAPSLTEYGESIFGTVIVWRVPVGIGATS